MEAYTESGQALQRIESQHFDLVITDIKMREPNGIEVMNFVKENHPSTKVIVITGFATVETAREVLKGGAVDFIYPQALQDEQTPRIGAAPGYRGHWREERQPSALAQRRVI